MSSSVYLVRENCWGRALREGGWQALGARAACSVSLLVQAVVFV